MQKEVDCWEYILDKIQKFIVLINRISAQHAAYSF